MTVIEPIELLAPARDLECGLAAINCGADAVYIGPPSFGARARAGNSLKNIEALARHAHKYWARVYVTVNTLLHDDELPEAVRLLHQLYAVGVDAAIIQDVGLLECDLPPLPLIASTQMHNHSPAKVAFLEQVGIRRVILAREMDLAQIRAIRRATTVELEYFIHGALCVCYSGQCYMSYAIGGRSGNRGECAQPCRRRYNLVDRNGKTLVQDRHLLSLRDLNLSAHLNDLMEAGITSLKIEGRLKDKSYVTNVVSYYRRLLDEALADKEWVKSSSGQSQIDMRPDPIKTFNRGYTTFFLHGRAASPGAIDTPKMVGEWVGEVVTLDGRSFTLDTDVELHNGDGLCFFDSSRTLRGTVVNAVRGRTIYPKDIREIKPGTRIYRNRDHAFLSRLQKSHAERQIDVKLKLTETPEGLALSATDEDGNVATGVLACEKVKAENPARALANLKKQLYKTGGTEFACSGLEIERDAVYFLPLAELNDLRRRTLEKLSAVRAINCPRLQGSILKNDAPYPQKHLTYLGNVLNWKAAAFYRRHGVTKIEPAAESGLDMQGQKVMVTRYCLKHQLGWCPRENDGLALAEPLYLADEDGREYKLRFNCADCEMEIFFQYPR